MKIAMLGLGEAGTHFANDLVNNGFTVAGWDPHPVRELDERIHFAASNSQAVVDADVVFSANLPEVSESIAAEVKSSLKAGVYYCEMNTSTPALKRKIEQLLNDSPTHLIDLAIMAPVPPKGIASPMLASGPNAADLPDLLNTVMDISFLNTQIGDAASRKLLRSIVYKGVAAVVCEAMEAAGIAQLEPYMRQQIATVIGDHNELVERFISGSRTHALRRSHEMQAVSDMLDDMQASSLMSTAALQNLQRYI